jgi:tetratricopeptide (TPR) repeat protein
LLAASRSSESRTAEQALELYGTRYPYPYEFLSALKLDPHNINLRRELGYLYLAINDKPKAIEQFELILSTNPKDWPAREQLNALRGFKTRPDEIPHPAPAGTPSTSNADPKAMGLKSLAAGYNNDAIKYFLQALEQDPKDSEVMLRLGWAYNAAKRDDEAKVWFDKARHAEDKQIASEASKAFHNLNGDPMPQTTVWALPMFSSRWHDLFTYSQIKRTIPIPGLGEANKLLSFYVSARFTGDVKSGLIGQNVAYPQYLSESAFIVGVGVASKTWHRITGWAEAGESIPYLQLKNVGAAMPDYRGGVNYAKGFGSLAGSDKAGLYYETTADAIYVSRFGKDWLFYSQNRVGRTQHIGDGNTLQVLMNGNVVTDVQRQYWANTFEFGPGVRFRPSWLPKNVYFSGDFLRGLFMSSNHSGYNDMRIGFWYAKTTK